ncbi:hypothetical protein F220043C3_42710 [Enterocloster asparagiformis]
MAISFAFIGTYALSFIRSIRICARSFNCDSSIFPLSWPPPNAERTPAAAAAPIHFPGRKYPQTAHAAHCLREKQNTLM